MYLSLESLYIYPVIKQLKVMTHQPKLGEIYKYVEKDETLKREECAYYVLETSNGKKPNRVALYNINPQTMTDDRKWKFRHIWSYATKVQDLDNISPEEWRSITGNRDEKFVNTFDKLSEADQAEVVEKFKAGKIVADPNSFLHRFKFVTKK
jgi:hypothetical protein